jgi:TPR repeat protein
LEAFSRLEGHGIESNTDEAIYYFEKAAKMGEGRAFYMLGVLQEEGTGSRKNPEKANELYRKAGELFDPEALFKLAI